jgi:hypothetical protein
MGWGGGGGGPIGGGKRWGAAAEAKGDGRCGEAGLIGGRRQQRPSQA